jgi:hypothetical protein
MVCQEIPRDKNCKKKPLADCQGLVINISFVNQPQPPLPQEPVLQPPPPTGFVELIEKPDRIPALIKSTFTVPTVFNRLLSIRNFNPS